MFSSVRSFLYRHRRKFLASGIIVGGAVLLTRYAQRVLREWQERETKEFLERTRKQMIYESNERACNKLALNLIETMKERVAGLIKTEELISKLKEGSTNKLALWETLKWMAFAKVTLVIYLSSLLMVMLRLQFPLIGGYMSREISDEGDEWRKRYLSLFQFLLRDGAANLCDVVTEKVKLVLSKKSLKEKLTIKDLEQLLWAIHSSISEDPRNPCQQLPMFIMATDTDDTSAAEYAAALGETRDLLESEEVMALTNSCVTRGFSYLIDAIAPFYDKNSPTEAELETPRATSSADSFFSANITENQWFDLNYSIALAKLIPIVNGLAVNQPSTTDLSYTWMQQLILMDNLKIMGANVFETFSVK